MFEKIFKMSGIMDIIISILFIIVGIMLIVNTTLMTSIFSIVLGGFFLVVGVTKMISYYSNNKVDSTIFGLSILSIIVGIVIMFFTTVILEFFRMIICIWIIYAAIMNLFKIIAWKDYSSKYWISTLIVTIILFLIGIYMLLNPAVILETIGVIIVVYGILNIIINIVFMNKLK